MKYKLEIYYTTDPAESPQVFEDMTSAQAEGALGAYWRDMAMEDTAVRSIRLLRV